MSEDLALTARIQAVAARQGVELTHLPEITEPGQAPADSASEVLIDLNLGETSLDCIRAWKKQAAPTPVVAFLDHFVGDLPIRAKLAGADRVIPQEQMERELHEGLEG